MSPTRCTNKPKYPNTSNNLFKTQNKMTKENYMYFVGALVRHHRKLQHMSLAELSEKSGVHIARLSGIENGKDNPTIATMKHIADALKLPLNSFFDF